MPREYQQDFTEYNETKIQSQIDDRKPNGITTSDGNIIKMVECHDEWLNILCPNT